MHQLDALWDINVGHWCGPRIQGPPSCKSREFAASRVVRLVGVRLVIASQKKPMMSEMKSGASHSSDPVPSVPWSAWALLPFAPVQEPEHKRTKGRHKATGSHRKRPCVCLCRAARAPACGSPRPKRAPTLRAGGATSSWRCVHCECAPGWAGLPGSACRGDTHHSRSSLVLRPATQLPRRIGPWLGRAYVSCTLQCPCGRSL